MLAKCPRGLTIKPLGKLPKGWSVRAPCFCTRPSVSARRQALTAASARVLAGGAANKPGKSSVQASTRSPREVASQPINALTSMRAAATGASGTASPDGDEPALGQKPATGPLWAAWRPFQQMLSACGRPFGDRSPSKTARRPGPEQKRRYNGRRILGGEPAGDAAILVDSRRPSKFAAAQSLAAA
jgi:hypothetical protein